MTADPLRERLRGLVEEWRQNSSDSGVLIYPPSERRVFESVAKRLAAILDETEPKRPGDIDWGEHDEHGPESCYRCAQREIQRERNARLKLGPRLMAHAFQPCESATCKGCHRIVGGLVCGQPREAHY